MLEALLNEMNRAREVLKLYEEIPVGAFGAMMIRQTIIKAEKAIASGDITQMIVSLQELKEVQ